MIRVYINFLIIFVRKNVDETKIKMFMHGNGSGCDLVKWMQLSGDL
jgi:hypothetical protein